MDYKIRKKLYILTMVVYFRNLMMVNRCMDRHLIISNWISMIKLKNHYQMKITKMKKRNMGTKNIMIKIIKMVKLWRMMLRLKFRNLQLIDRLLIVERFKNNLDVFDKLYFMKSDWFFASKIFLITEVFSFILYIIIYVTSIYTYIFNY